ncbi:MAG: ribonuclease P protein component [Simkaniaceae bacterium]|nr:ribonuclease P protein component [Simkaniaceae bacterium]
MDFSYLKSHRLLKRSEFKRVSFQGKRFFSKYCCIHYQHGNPSSARLGITVTKKFGSAPERNAFKRKIREIFRHKRASLPSTLELNIRPILSKKQMDWTYFTQDITTALSQLEANTIRKK